MSKDHLSEFRTPIPPDFENFRKTWRLHPHGPLLGTIDIISPWTGGPTEAVVDIDNKQVIAAHGASVQPFDFIFKLPSITEKSV